MRHRPQLRAEPSQRRRRDHRAEISGQLAACRRLDRGKHIDGAATGKKSRHNVRRHRKSGTREFLGGDACGDGFTIDKNTVAVEDDHGFPPRPDQPLLAKCR
jgi:hypothetical protein